MSRDYGCGDNSCVFGSPGGMATNGGCRCFEEMAQTPEGREARRRLTRGILVLRQQAAQPVDCQHCLKLIDERDLREEQIGRAAAALGMEDEWTSACDVGEALIERCEEISAAANSVLIQQAAQGRKVELGKVREFFNYMQDFEYTFPEAAGFDAALAELDAAEGKGEGRG